MTETQEAFQKVLTGVAEKNLGIVTLETRNCDFLDFHELAIWQIKEALQDAFIAGMTCGAGLNKVP